MHADETRPARSDLAPRALGREADLVHDAQNTFARLFGDIRLLVQDARNGRYGDSAGRGDIDDRRLGELRARCHLASAPSSIQPR